MTSGVDGPWILCRVTRGTLPSNSEVIVIMKSDYDLWSKTFPSSYEFIARGKRELMRQYRDLMKET